MVATPYRFDPDRRHHNPLYYRRIDVRSQTLRLWRNWQTRTVEGRVLRGVWVQVPPTAPKRESICICIYSLAILKYDLELELAGLKMSCRLYLFILIRQIFFQHFQDFGEIQWFSYMVVHPCHQTVLYVILKYISPHCDYRYFFRFLRTKISNTLSC